MRNLLFLALLAFALRAPGADQPLDFRPLGVGTSATPVVVALSGPVAFSGTPVYLSFTASTNMSFEVSTAAGHGLSLGGARTVVAATTNTMALNVAITNGVRLASDRLVASFYSAADSNATAVLRLLLE
jgi:hypothetical protein